MKIKQLVVISLFSTINCFAQIPNNGFENWNTVGSYENPAGWNNCNSSSTGTFFPVTKSTDHYPPSIGNFSIRMENKVPLANCSNYGFAQTSNNNNPCAPAFPITGHPTSFCGYYKSFPQNNDTMQIALMLFKNGAWVAGAELTTTTTVSNWTSFNIPISSYTNADSATIVLAAFYNNSSCGFPFGPFGNSVLYVDNISFDNLITTGISEIEKETKLSVYPNPFSTQTTFQSERFLKNASLTIYNSAGQAVKIVDGLTGHTVSFQRDDLPGGLYFFRLTQDGSMISTDKFVISDR